MSSHSANRNRPRNENIDSLIRWALHDTVADAEPSPELWDRIEGQILENSGAKAKNTSPWRKALSRRRWWSQLVGAGARFPVPGDPRLAWQRRLVAFDIRAPLSSVRIIEGKMPFLRLVA